MKKIFQDNVFLTAFSLAIIIFISFYPALQNGFLVWDDQMHITENAYVCSLGLNNIKEIFSNVVFKVYMPLTILSFAVEYAFVKLNPFLYHLDNVILHGVVTLLFFIFLKKVGFSMRAAALAALLFGIHPMHVESVAWASERKDVLYSVFYISSIYHYWQYVKLKKKKNYYFTVVLGLLSMLAKPMALSLPLVFLLLDWISERKIDRKMFFDKVPHFLYIVPLAWITYSHNMRYPEGAFFEGLLIWIWSFTFYIQKFVFPAVLIPIYPLPQPVSLFNFHFLFSLLLFVLIAVFVFLNRKKRWVVAPIIYYFLTLFFLLRFDAQEHSIVADRYMYMPSIGFCMLFGFFVNEGMEKLSLNNFRRVKKGGNLLIGLFFILLFTGTYRQCQVWKDDLTFWTYIIEKNPKGAIAFNDRGLTYYKKHLRDDLALKDFNQAIKLNPDYAEAYTNRGILHLKNDRYNLAYNDFEQAIRLNPKDPASHINKALIHSRRGEYEMSLRTFDRALEVSPNFYRIHFARALVFKEMKKFDSAFRDFNQSLRQLPSFWEGYYERGRLFKATKVYDRAINDFEQAIKLNPHFVKAYKSRGLIYALSSKFDLAIEDFSKTIVLNPADQDNYLNRALAYSSSGNTIWL